MKRRNVHRIHRAAPARTQNPLQWRVLLLTLFCVAVVAAGFFFAARQHFATMEFGLKNSKLRKQVEDLEAERRRLILAKEVSLSPVELRQTAAKLGFREQIAAPPTAAEAKMERPAPTSEPKVELTSLKTGGSKAVDAKTTETKKLVKPIVQQTAVKTGSPDVRPRIASPEKEVASASAKSYSKLR
jgi:hypothetical protein